MKTSSKKWQKIRKIKGLRQFVTWYPRHVSENPGYKEVFLDDIPRAMMRIRYVNDIWTGSDELVDCLSVIRKRSYFFNYVDKDFGEKVKENCQEIEDFLACIDQTELTNEKYRKSYTELENKIKKIYDLVTKRFY